MSDTRITVTISQEVKDQLKKIYPEDSDSWAASQIVIEAVNLYQATLTRDGMKLFTPDELEALASVMNTWALDVSVASAPRECLLHELEDHYALERYEEFPASFRAKIERLPQFQAWVLLRTLKQLWTDTDTLFDRAKFLFGIES